MAGPIDNQPSTLSLSQAMSSSKVAEQVKTGRLNGDKFVVNQNAQSLISSADGAEEVSLLFAGKNKLKLGNKKEKDEARSQKMKIKESTSPSAGQADSQFEEEKSALIRLIRKFNKNETLSEDDKDKIDEWLAGMDDDTNAVADKLFVKAVEIIDKEGRRDEFAETLDKLRLMLSTANSEKKKVDDTFWGELSGLDLITAKGEGFQGESSRVFAETLKATGARLKKDYGSDEHLAVIAIEIKKIGHELGQIGQADNNPARLLILGKEMHLLQVYRTANEHCAESEQKIVRTYGYNLQPSKTAPDQREDKEI